MDAPTPNSDSPDFCPWSSDLLEFDDLRAILKRYVPSPLGRARLEELGPSTDRAAIEEVLAETAEAIAYLQASRSAKLSSPTRLRFSDLPDVAEAAARLRIEGAVLDGEELFAVGIVLGRAHEARQQLTAAGGRLAERVAPIPDLKPLLRELDGKVMPDGTLADDASVALMRLRRDRVRQQQSIRDSLEKFVKAHRDDGVLQEEYVTVRNDRYVVPVVAGRRKQADGVIHGASSTGQTLFIEPLETIDLNNGLVRITEEEAREIHRILRELTAKLRAAGDAVPVSVRVLGELELLFGKADYALDFDCVIPTFGDRLKLRGARHPLLADLLRKKKARIVPVTIELDREHRVLLITGPNTGGKTVAMKTAGLLALMAQSGLPVPCEEAELPIFYEVLADIGDNQSIAESLSSFSAHVRRLALIVDAATPDSLVLMDELGRATDPEEGGALGVAVVDSLKGIGAFVIASTHLLALKVYGATAAHVVNGSMGFDEETLTTTYILRTGAPGRSAGLSIASRLGLPPQLIERARAAMTSNERDIARLITELHLKIEQASQRESELTQLKAALALREQTLEDEYSKKKRELERKLDALMADVESKTRDAVEQVRATAASRKASDQAQLTASKAQREIREQIRTVIGSAAPVKNELRLEEGVRVRVQGVREIAQVRRILGDNVEVQAGLMKLQVPRADITEILPPGQTGVKLPKNVSFEAGPSWTLSQREINVIGKTADEARDEIDRFIDKASMASVDRIRIVHGHGMGILKRAVAELLNRHPLVDRTEAATPGEGGSGAIIAWLRD